MIVLGIDPGARWTGVAVIDTMGDFTRRPELVTSRTIDRGPTAEDPDGLVEIPDAYLFAVTSAVESLARMHPISVAGVETVRRPSWRVKGKAKPLDPAAIMGTAVVLGAVREALGRASSGLSIRSPFSIEIIRPMGNGRLFPLPHYPGPLATTGAGQDKRRHERSAYDVAVMAAQQSRSPK